MVVGYTYKKQLYRLERSYLDYVMSEGFIRLASEDEQNGPEFHIDLPNSFKRKRVGLEKKHIPPHMRVTVQTLIDTTALPAEEASR